MQEFDNSKLSFINMTHTLTYFLLRIIASNKIHEKCRSAIPNPTPPGELFILWEYSGYDMGTPTNKRVRYYLCVRVCKFVGECGQYKGINTSETIRYYIFNKNYLVLISLRININVIYF